MGDHFVLLVDRLLTESTLEAAIESNQLKELATSPATDSTTRYSSGAISSPTKIVECRICQDDDFDSNMVSPCSCCGSLKYAHRRCVQRWCNEKGDIVCEICHQQFRPGYTASPSLFRLSRIPVNLRGNWGIVRRDLNNPRLISMLSTNRNEYNDYAFSTSRCVICCRTIAIIFMVLLVLRHSLPIIVSRAGRYSFPLVLLLLLRICGIIFPIYMILKAVTALVDRRQQQQSASSISRPDEEIGSLQEPDHTVIGNVQ